MFTSKSDVVLEICKHM